MDPAAPRLSSALTTRPIRGDRGSERVWRRIGLDGDVMILLEPLRFCSRISPFACRSPQEMADQLLDLPFPLANEGDESQLLNLDSTHQRFIYDRGELNHVLPGRIGIAR